MQFKNKHFGMLYINMIETEVNLQNKTNINKVLEGNTVMLRFSNFFRPKTTVLKPKQYTHAQQNSFS
jgi:hypothetical protein